MIKLTFTRVKTQRIPLGFLGNQIAMVCAMLNQEALFSLQGGVTPITYNGWNSYPAGREGGPGLR